MLLIRHFPLWIPICCMDSHQQKCRLFPFGVPTKNTSGIVCLHDSDDMPRYCKQPWKCMLSGIQPENCKWFRSNEKRREGASLQVSNTKYEGRLRWVSSKNNSVNVWDVHYWPVTVTYANLSTNPSDQQESKFSIVSPVGSRAAATVTIVHSRIAFMFIFVWMQ